MSRVLKMFHNTARDNGNMVSIYRHSKIEDCIAQFDKDRADRFKRSTITDEYETLKLRDLVKIDKYGIYCNINTGGIKHRIRWIDKDCLNGEPKDCMAWNE